MILGFRNEFAIRRELVELPGTESQQGIAATVWPVPPPSSRQTLPCNPIPLGFLDIEPYDTSTFPAQISIKGFRANKYKQTPVLEADTACLRRLAQLYCSDQVRPATMRAPTVNNVRPDGAFLA